MPDMHSPLRKIVSDSVGMTPSARPVTRPEGSDMSANDRSEYVQISARIPSDLAEGLEEAAEREDRTLSAELRRAIRLYLTPSMEGAA